MGIQQSPEYRAQAHDLEVRSINYPGVNRAGFSKPDHGESNGREFAERAQRFHSRAQVSDLRYRKVAGCALVDVDEPVLVAIHQRA